MVQSQFESFGFQGPSTPTLSNCGLVKQMMVETQVKRIAQLSSPSMLDGLKSMPIVPGAASANALVSNSERVTESAMGLTASFGLGAVTKAAKFGSKVAAIASSVMALKGEKNETNTNDWDGIGDAMVIARKSPKLNVDTVLAKPAAYAGLLQIGFAGKSAPTTATSSKCGTIELASSLRIIPQPITVENSILSGATTEASIEMAPAPAQVLRSDNQDGKEEMKTADTAGDGIIATVSRTESCDMVKDFTPPADSCGTQERARIAETMAEPAASAASSVPLAKSKTDVQTEGSTEVSPKLAALARNIDIAFQDAQRHAKAFEHQRAQRQAERDINDIETGRRKFVSVDQRDLALAKLREQKRSAEESLRIGVPARYAQTLKKLFDYSKAVESYFKAEMNTANRDTVLRDAVKTLESLMSPIDNIWNGIPGKTPDLARPGVRGQNERPIWPEERLSHIQDHLDAKINTVDNAQAQRIGVVKDNLTMKELIRQHGAGELPKDGSVVFFTDEGTLLYQSELKVSQRSTLARAKDNASAEKHANNTPAFIDIAKLDRGLGPEGAGLWRFIGQEHRIVGAAILQPVIKDGKLVELPNTRNRNGEPTIKKEVSKVIGEVPAEVTTTMAYGHMLNCLRSKKIAGEKVTAPNAVPLGAALVGTGIADFTTVEGR